MMAREPNRLGRHDQLISDCQNRLGWQRQDIMQFGKRVYY